MSRLATAIGVVRAARWIEIRDVVEAEIALLRAQAMRWVRPLGQLVDVAEQPPAAQESPTLSEREAAERLAKAVNRATRYGVFHPSCLARAVALTHLLDAHGISGHRIRIGVRRAEGNFTAHAWVELGNGIVGDCLWRTNAYVPLASARVIRSGILGGGAKVSGRSGFLDGEAIWDQ